MPNLKDLTKLYNSSCRLIESANELATIVRYTVEDVAILQEYVETGKKIIELDRSIKLYALEKTDELSENSKSLN